MDADTISEAQAEEPRAISPTDVSVAILEVVSPLPAILDAAYCERALRSLHVSTTMLMPIVLADGDGELSQGVGPIQDRESKGRLVDDERDFSPYGIAGK